MIKGLLTASWLFLLLSISNLTPPLTHAEAIENSSRNAASVINVNTASAEEIAAVPGLGEKKSLAIVKFREKNGPLARIEDLKKVNGIGDILFDKVRPYITVKSDTTAKQPQK